METTATEINEEGQDIDICRVCELVDGDTTVKPVVYCSVCDSKICDDCRPKVKKRAIAAVKEFFLKKK